MVQVLLPPVVLVVVVEKIHLILVVLEPQARDLMEVILVLVELVAVVAVVAEPAPAVVPRQGPAVVAEPEKKKAVHSAVPSAVPVPLQPPGVAEPAPAVLGAPRGWVHTTACWVHPTGGGLPRLGAPGLGAPGAPGCLAQPARCTTMHRVGCPASR